MADPSLIITAVKEGLGLVQAAWDFFNKIKDAGDRVEEVRSQVDVFESILHFVEHDEFANGEGANVMRCAIRVCSIHLKAMLEVVASHYPKNEEVRMKSGQRLEVVWVEGDIQSLMEKLQKSTELLMSARTMIL